MSNLLRLPSPEMKGHTNFTAFYALNRPQVRKVCDYLQTATFLDNIKLLFQNPANNIINLKCYPFSVKSALGYTDEDTKIKISDIETDCKGCKIDDDVLPIFDLGSIFIEEYFYSFLDYAPYTKIELYLPYIGFITLDTNMVMNREISIQYVIDIFTGKCTAFISRGSAEDKNIIMSCDGNIGIDIQIGGGQNAEIAKNMLSLGVTASTQLATGVPLFNTPESVNLLANSGINIIQAGQQHINKGNLTQSAIGFYAPQNCYLIITRPSPEYPNNYNHTVGRPSGKTATLGDLTGYTVVDSIHVEGLDTATSDEVTEVERLLKQGVIL